MIKDIIKSIFIFMLIVIFMPATALAAGISINYPGYPGPLFNVTNIKPGDTYTKTITVTNDNAITENLGLKITSTTTGILADAILITIRDGATNGIIDIRSISGYVSAGEIPLGTLAPSTSKDYVLIANFDSNYGNAYQGLTETFDMSLGFIGTPAGPTAPGGTGNLLTRLGTAVSGFSGFTPTVQGATLTAPEVAGEVRGDTKGEDSREQTGITRTCPWWWIIGLILLAVLAFIGGVIKAMPEYHFVRKFYYAWPILLGILAWVLHYYLHNGYTATWFCNNYLLVIVIITLLAEVLYITLVKRSKEEERK